MKQKPNLMMLVDVDKSLQDFALYLYTQTPLNGTKCMQLLSLLTWILYTHTAPDDQPPEQVYGDYIAAMTYELYEKIRNRG